MTFDRFKSHWALLTGSVWFKTFDEFFTTALLHNPTGKGGFAISFYVLPRNAMLGKAIVPTIPAFASYQLLLAREAQAHACQLCARYPPCVNWLQHQHHPSRVVTTSLCYRSEFPSLWHRCPVTGRHNNWVTLLVFGSYFVGNGFLLPNPTKYLSRTKESRIFFIW
jgi:hypothetical protein